MTTRCPVCAQILSIEGAKRCPACGSDIHVRRLAPLRAVHDDDAAAADTLDADNGLLLVAAIADVGTRRPPAPLVPSLEERMTPLSGVQLVGDPGVRDPGVRDLLPADTLVRRRFTLRRR